MYNYVPFFPSDVDASMCWGCGHIGLDDWAKALQYQLHHLTGRLDMEGVSTGDQGMELRQNEERHF